VLDRRLAQHEFVADDYSIADIAIWPWASLANEDNEIDEDCAGLHQADAVFAVDDRRKPMGLGTYSNCDPSSGTA
jgi:glutathione S-transferase